MYKLKASIFLLVLFAGSILALSTLVELANSTPSQKTTIHKTMNWMFDRPAIRVLVRCENKLKVEVAGTYELKEGENTYRGVLLENGTVETTVNGEAQLKGKWEIMDGEVYLDRGIYVMILSINPDGSLTRMAKIEDGKRIDIPKEERKTYRKI